MQQEKLNAIHDDVKEIKEQLAIMNGRQRDDHDRITRLEERTGILAGVGAAWATIVAAVAAYLGMR